MNGLHARRAGWVYRDRTCGRVQLEVARPRWAGRVFFDGGVAAAAQGGRVARNGVVSNNVGFYRAPSNTTYAATVWRCNNSVAAYAHRWRGNRACARARARRITTPCGCGRVLPTGGARAYRDRYADDDGATAGIGGNRTARQGITRGWAAAQDAVAAAARFFSGRT